MIDEIKIQKKIGLALSGGGYRAAAYHIGTLRALNRLGILDRIDVISAVSGGSIVAAYYALHKTDYQHFERTFVEKLHKGVLLLPIIKALLILIPALSVIALFPFWWTGILFFVGIFFLQFKLFPFSFWIEKAYNNLFFDGAVLSNFPDRPLVAINSTNVATGKLFTFSRDKMSEYTYEGRMKKKIFNHENFPIAKAVMASSCVPFAFPPVKITKKYLCSSLPKYQPLPLLIDGGLYDNQGAHKLTEKSSVYHTQFNIVSDAGNSTLSAKWSFNSLILLAKTAEIMMQRIRTFQSSQNMFYGKRDGLQYAYLGLVWTVSDQPVVSFVNNLAQNNISEKLIDFHHISQDDIANIRGDDEEISSVAKQKVINQLKESIGWSNLETIMPSVAEHSVAKKIRTSLTRLDNKKINSLIKHSNWLTEVQVRLYLPYLITNNPNNYYVENYKV
jgi:NTE family protein